MSGIAINVATPLAGGEWFSGITVAVTAQMIWQFGLRLGIMHDRKRQILLNLICFICALNTTISYGFNATKQSVTVSDITTVITFMSVQWGLVILNHNTFIRALNLVHVIKVERKVVEKACLVLYLLPVLAMIPMYLSFKDTAGTGKAMNTSSYNSLIYKPLNIALIFSTEFFAIVTDILLLMKVKGGRENLTVGARSGENMQANATTSAGDRTRSVVSSAHQLASRDLWMGYAITWGLVFTDLVVKVLIATGQPLLFDSIITITAIAMRARVNLQYGLELQAIINGPSNPGANTGNVGHMSRARSGMLGSQAAQGNGMLGSTSALPVKVVQVSQVSSSIV